MGGRGVILPAAARHEAVLESRFRPTGVCGLIN
jgi:hypothetical protein